jgi:hypothetical protein
MLTLLFRPWLSAQQQLLLRCSGAVHFCHSAVRQLRSDSIWQRVIKKVTKKALFTQLFRRYSGSEQYASECALVNINLLKPTGYVMHHQFNIQQLYALSTLYLYVLYLSENKQQLVPLTA